MGLKPPDLCDTRVALSQQSQQANWELVIMLVPNYPWSGELMTVNIWNSHNYVNCGWRNEYRNNPHSYELYLSSSENNFHYYLT